MKRIMFIHGANSTKRSFAFLAPALPKHESFFFEYDSKVPALENIDKAQVYCDSIQPDAIVGHSLGGVMTAYLETSAKKVALAAPFGGSAIADWLPLYSQVMRDVSTKSPLTLGVRSMEAKDFLCIVANGLDGAGFDGVLTAASQKKLHGAEYRCFNLNHFEVLVDEQIANMIQEWLCLAATS